MTYVISSTANEKKSWPRRDDESGFHDTLTAELRQAFRILKQERIAQGLSLADMRDRTGMSRSAVSRLENDDAANPTIETLSRYAEALGKELAITLTDKAS